jgi:hypothetical protein
MTTAQAVLVQANVFELEGYNTRISYASTSITGVPELTYVSRGVTLKFRGDQIRSEKTTIGQLLSVPLSGSSPAIGPVEALTLVLPAVTVPADTRQSSIQTMAVLSTRVVPGKLPNQAQEYLPLCLAGTAQQIDF